MFWVCVVTGNCIMRSFVVTGVSKGMIRWTGEVAYMGEKRNACEILVGRPEGKRSRGRPGHSWEDNIELHLKKCRMGRCS
jgi:hypothetical protein